MIFSYIFPGFQISVFLGLLYCKEDVFLHRKRVVGHLDTVGLLDSENSMAIECLDSLTFAGLVAILELKIWSFGL